MFYTLTNPHGDTNIGPIDWCGDWDYEKSTTFSYPELLEATPGRPMRVVRHSVPNHDGCPAYEIADRSRPETTQVVDTAVRATPMWVATYLRYRARHQPDPDDVTLQVTAAGVART
ncbi:hypothetical protein [Nocardia sp. CNY236]|uniref:hypothetical protein n=1 Tax=Nocardia sp. CNY236 TaxID=1169152 RepID=UPI00042309C7|nr:hypothetical protein [Nocardia sp. CNY236]